MQFSDFLGAKGIEDTDKLTTFVDEFLENPSIFFELSEDDRTTLEKQIDKALLICRDNISFQ